MKKPVQALIAAGGYGSRLGLKPNLSKSLLKTNGQTFLAVLLTRLVKSGIDDFVIATHAHTEKKVKAEAERCLPGTASALFVKCEDGFRKIPLSVQEHLHERFIFICGHHAIPEEHIRNMLSASQSYEYVLSGYQNEKFPLEKEERITFEDGGLYLRHHSELEKQHVYVRNPFIIDKRVISSSEQEGCKKTFSRYVLEEALQTNTWAVIESSFPPEFDTQEDLRITHKNLKTPTSF